MLVEWAGYNPKEVRGGHCFWAGGRERRGIREDSARDGHAVTSSERRRRVCTRVWSDWRGEDAYHGSSRSTRCE